jgi:hypothetical protein
MYTEAVRQKGRALLSYRPKDREQTNKKIRMR